MITAFFIILIIIAIIYIYTFQPKFGRKASGERLQAILKSPNVKNGKFQNVHDTPSLTEGYTIPDVLYEFIFKRSANRNPPGTIPSVKTDLLDLPLDKDALVWFGHSSYYIQLDGKRMLIDPVLSGNASPISGSNKAFRGTDVYTVADIPALDYLFITHDHYDHLDHETIVQLKTKVKKVICGLGVGAHLERWGYAPSILIEKDWNETVELDKGFTVYTTPARHFSGRGFIRNTTLWLSYVLQTPSMKIFIGGDSGYDTHFKEIGTAYGPFDLAILENGQYDIKWKYIHALPEEVLQAADELKAKRIFPVHSGKFAMANHAWDEPLKKITDLNKSTNIPLLTPMIGEIVNLKDNQQQFKQWWAGIK
jgi:L-ascorbate metabolism protein UlaG (beta-lactamase superfamily)